MKSSKKVEKVAEEIGYPGFGKNVLKSSKKVEKVAEEIGYPEFFLALFLILRF